MTEIKGVIPAMATPMGADGSLRTEAVAALADRLIQEGASGLFVAGSMGEAASLDAGERLQMVRAAVRAARGRVPVLAGTGFITTRETVRMTKMCEDEGVAAVSVITPYYWKLSQEALYRHYAAVISATTLPVFAYNLPGSTGNHLEADTLGRLYRQEGLRGAKDSSARWENTKAYMDAVDEGFTMLVGEDTLCLQGLCYGAKGSISAPSNACTRVMAAIYARFAAGDLPGARRAQEDWNELIRLMGSTGGFPGNFQLAADRLTAPVGPARPPVLSGDPAALEAALPRIREILARY